MFNLVRLFKPSDLPPPTVTPPPITDPTNGTIPIPFPPYGGATMDGGVWATIFLFVGIFLLFVYWYYKKGISEELERLKTRHFVLRIFLDDTETTNLEDYNRKYLIIIALGFAGMLAIPMTSAAVIPDSIMFVRGIVTIMGYLMMILFLWNFLSTMTNNEVRSMQNAVWFEVELYIPDMGTFHKMWKKVVPEKLIVLSDKQLNQLADEVIRNSRRYGYKFKKNQSGKVKDAIISRLRKMYVYRVSVKGKGDYSYKLLVVLKHKWNSVINPNEEDIFHRTTEVTVRRAPMSVAYIGESNRIFQDLDNKGSPKMAELTQGVFMSLVDRVDISNLIVEGRLDSPSNFDAIAAQMLSYYEQEATTSEFVNGKINALNKRDKEYDDLAAQKDEESQAQFNTYLRVFNRLFMKHQQKGLIGSMLGYAIIFFFVYYALFAILGWLK